MRGARQRHAYRCWIMPPLIGERFAMIGDAAVDASCSRMAIISAFSAAISLLRQSVKRSASALISARRNARKLYRNTVRRLCSLLAPTAGELFTMSGAIEAVRCAVLRAGNMLLPFKKARTHHLTTTLCA